MNISRFNYQLSRLGITSMLDLFVSNTKLYDVFVGSFMIRKLLLLSSFMLESKGILSSFLFPNVLLGDDRYIIAILF